MTDDIVHSGHIKTLIINGERYDIYREPDGDVSFYRVGTEVDAWSLELETIYDRTEFEDTINPVKVIRAVTQAIKNWIRLKHPHYLSFEANSDKKAKIYERIFQREIPSLTDYNYATHNGRLHLYRKPTRKP